MNKKQKQQYDALNDFKNYCNDHSIVWSLMVAFANAFTALGVKLQSILSTDSQQEKNYTGVTTAKSDMKSMMANNAITVAAAIQAYASTNKMPDLFKEMQISYTQIFRTPNATAISKAQAVLDTANRITVAVLKPFGISPTVVQSLGDIIQSYTNSGSSSTNKVKVDKKKYTRNLDTLIKEANTIMRKQMLKMGTQFKTTNPDFYNGMIDSARVSNAVVHTKLKITITGDVMGAILPVAGCLVQIDGTDLKGTTNAKGYCMISSVPDGIQNVTIIKKDYTTMNLEALAFVRGKSTTQAVELTPAFNVPAVSKQKVTN